MFFEATYVPSPPLSVASIDEEVLEANVEVETPSIQEPDIEPSSDKPVDHLIFVIHGIGQQTEQYGHFYEHIENLQETTRQVLQAKVPDHNVRIELIPIEWHRHIHEQVDPIINKITLKSIPTIRLIENDYLADVLFYFSKDRGQNIIDNVTNLFNTSYHNFMEKHPNFNGKIVVMGYSLGGIIVWDILSHQREPINEAEEKMYSKSDVNFGKLDFKPDYFFGLGSPISAVLTFRGQDPIYYHPDHDIQFENIFHPFDPLGYRFEPLYNDYFIDKPAVLVERSIPIGPSFSFPSILTSLFNWQTTQDRNKTAKTIFNATEEIASQEIKNDQSEVEESSGFIANLLSYFSKTEEKQIKKELNPFIEKTRQELLALRDDLDKTLNNSNIRRTTINRRNSIKISRSKTSSNIMNQYSTSLKHNSDGSIYDFKQDDTDENMKNDSESNHSVEKRTRIPLRKTMTEHHSNNPSNKIHHLVEVLGIDGIPRMDSSNDNITSHHNKKEENHEGNDLWLDLNNELNKPGPAITSPGESKANIAQDATVPKSSHEIDQSAEKTDSEQVETSKLPGKCRIDYVLQPESVMSMIANEYLIGLRAHFSYWTNKDLLWHMLRRIENLDNNTTSNVEDTTNVKPIIQIDDRNISKQK